MSGSKNPSGYVVDDDGKTASDENLLHRKDVKDALADMKRHQKIRYDHLEKRAKKGGGRRKGGSKKGEDSEAGAGASGAASGKQPNAGNGRTVEVVGGSKPQASKKPNKKKDKKKSRDNPQGKKEKEEPPVDNTKFLQEVLTSVEKIQLTCRSIEKRALSLCETAKKQYRKNEKSGDAMTMDAFKEEFGKLEDWRKRKDSTGYIPSYEAWRGVECGVYAIGSLRVNQFNSDEAYVTISGGGENFLQSPAERNVDLLVKSSRDQNRAISDDTVIVRILPRSAWRTLNTDSQSKASKEGNRRPVGEVVFVVCPKICAKVHVGYLRKHKSEEAVYGKLDEDNEYYDFKSMDPKAPRIVVPRSGLPDTIKSVLKKHRHSLFACQATRWEPSDPVPIGRFLPDPLIGDIDDVEAGTRALLLRYQIDDHDFSPHVLQCFSEEWEIPEEEYATRKDCRDMCIFTIDPATARDLDDAISIEKLPNGRVRIGVHIADVSYFVKPNTSLDEEAQRRATTTYLVHRCIPMLPPVLCEKLCSLNAGVDRLAFSVFWTMDLNGKLSFSSIGEEQSDVWCGRTIIRSGCRLAYETAQAIIDGDITSADGMLDQYRPHDPWKFEQIRDRLRLVHKVGMARRRFRFDPHGVGSMKLDQPKVTFDLNDMLEPVEMGTYALKESNNLIEELMLLANMLVARRLLQVVPQLAVVRYHPIPTERKFNDFRAHVFEQFQVDFPESSLRNGTEFYECMREVEIHYPDNVRAIEHIATRSMQNARYGCSGELEAYHHYALNFAEYTHFTSPIRRYPDVLVHRLLQFTIDIVGNGGSGGGGFPSIGEDDRAPYSETASDLQSQCEHCSEKQMNAKRCQEQHDQLYMSVFLKTHSVEENASIIDIMESKVVLVGETYGVECRLTLNAIGSALGGHARPHAYGTSIRAGQGNGGGRGRRRRRGKTGQKEDEDGSSDGPKLWEIIVDQRDPAVQDVDESSEVHDDGAADASTSASPLAILRVFDRLRVQLIRGPSPTGVGYIAIMKPLEILSRRYELNAT